MKAKKEGVVLYNIHTLFCYMRIPRFVETVVEFGIAIASASCLHSVSLLIGVGGASSN